MIIEALAIAKKSNLNIKLIQIGVGPDTANLQLQAKNHRVENNIFWAGATDNVDELNLVEIRNNFEKLASSGAFYTSAIDAESIRAHMIQSITKVSNI
jgi:glycosyltransferase involved in cell wall biosynthesis